jgi:peptidoglycan/LPS O-acetylase OafA/YrhL
LPAVDAVRAIGAIAVLGTHVAFNTGAVSGGVWGGFLARLDVGVAIFFVLSGFLLFRPFADAAARGASRPGFGRYLWRRALRILPAYWLALVAALLLLPQNRSAPAGDWLRYASLTQIYSPDWNRHGLSQTWSLATEVAFYLLLPAAVITMLRRQWRPGRTLAVTAVAGLFLVSAWFAGMAAGPLSTKTHGTWLPTFALWFAAGMALATVHVAARTGAISTSRWRLLDEFGAAPVTCLVLALGLFAVASTPVTGPRDLTPASPAELAVRTVLFGAIAALVLVPAAFGPATRFKALLETRPARWLGTVSYGLFLWQLVALELIYLAEDRPPFTGDLLSTFALTFVVSLVLASLSYYLLERPVMRWGSRWPRGPAEAGGEPERRNGKHPHDLRAGSPVGVVGGQPQPPRNGEEPDREPRLQQA